MIDHYLYTFNKLFYNINENETVNNIVEQASDILASIITKFGEIENEICYGTSKQDDFVDTVVCLFVRKIMEQLDAINVLVSVGSFTQAQIILRSLIENIISLKFMLKADTKKRAAAYFLEHHYQEIELGKELFDTQSEYRKQVIAIHGEEKFSYNLHKYNQKKEAFDRIVNSKQIFQEVDRDRKQKLQREKRHIYNGMRYVAV